MTHFSAGTFAFLEDLSVLRVFTPDEVAAEPGGFVETAAELLVRLVPLWRTYLEGL